MFSSSRHNDQCYQMYAKCQDLFRTTAHVVVCNISGKHLEIDKHFALKTAKFSTICNISQTILPFYRQQKHYVQNYNLEQSRYIAQSYVRFIMHFRTLFNGVRKTREIGSRNFCCCSRNIVNFSAVCTVCNCVCTC